MSHLKERKEKTCLNCNSPVEVRYCSVCGQENLEPQEGVFHLVSHFFNDITHFDGKFFSSLKYLIIRPGFLSKEYVAGKRASYLNPIRMYVFTSFIFFLIFFTFKVNLSESGHEDKAARTSKEVRQRAIKDSVANALMKDGLIDSAQHKKFTINKKGEVDAGDDFGFDDYRDAKQYDSLIAAGIVHDNFFVRWFQHRQFKLDEKYGRDGVNLNDKLRENWVHSAPQMFFLSLPFLALFLKLIYIRRKQYYYVAHAIFVVHLFIFIYIATLVIFGLNALAGIAYLDWLKYISVAVLLGIFFYAYKAMRKFYAQGRAKTIFKFVLLLLAFLVISMISMSVMGIYSYMKL